MSILNQIQQMEQSIHNFELNKSRLETQLENCRHQYEMNEKELESMGINPENAQAELQELATLIKKELKELQELMSPNLIKELQEELNRPIEVSQSTVDYGLEF